MKLNHPKPTQLRQKRPNPGSPNAVKNQKYDVFVFLPVVFYEQLKLFFDLYLLLVALKIGLRFRLVLSHDLTVMNIAGFIRRTSHLPHSRR